MDPSAHHQILYGNYKAREPMNGLSNPQTQTQDHQLKKPRPQPSEQSLKCPRCDSTNTKFCYYNNYSLSQPRYFCKSCRRYWTKGGTLRNIPVGGGCRKNKRSSSSSSMTARSSRATPEPIHDIKTLAAASFGDYNDQIDLGLAFSLLNKQPPGSQLGFPTEFGGSLDDVWRKSSNGVFGLNQNERSVENVDFAFGNANAGGMDQVAGDPNMALWGYPWQMNGESFKMMNMVGFDNQIDSRREIWSGNNNGLPNSSWHGLLNSGALF